MHFPSLRSIVPSLGLLAIAGCTSPVESTGKGDTPSSADAVGEARQALAATCVTLPAAQNSGIASGTEASTNMSASETASVGNSSGMEHDTLLQFDLGSIPPNAGIASATLGLDVWKASGASTVDAYFITSPWTESTTWNAFGGAYSSPAAASFSNGGPVAVGGDLAITGDVTSMVQSWVVNGGHANDGLLLKENDSNTTTFWTRRQPIQALQPSLAVCYGGCAAGYADCDGVASNGCEVDINGDANNCGGCGVVCASPHASEQCSAGACTITVCNPGFADCDLNPADGCETNIGNDPNNCGACGVACILPHAVPQCSAGACGIAVCDAGYYDCDGNAANGCEATSCGDGQPCTSNAGCQSGICTGGVCVAPADCAAETTSNCVLADTVSGSTSGACASGFGAGSCSYACTNGVWTEVSDTCAPAACTAATENRNCTVSTTNSGGTSGACASGFGAGSCSYACTNGVWSQVTDTCAPAACTAATENGNCTVSATNSGSTSGTCASGFGVGSCSFSCANGVWSQVSDTCAAAACTAATENGNCTVSATASGSTSGTCASGFGAGSCSYSCANGVWSQVSDTCAPAACTAATENGNCTVSTTNSGSTSGTCASGYTGACSFACSNGAWTQVSDSCAQGCVIGGTTHAAGTVNPSNSCQACQPSLSTTAYTNVPAGGNTSTCAASAGDVCSGSGTCVSECFIGGALVASGAINPSGTCQECIPTSSTTGYTAVANGTNTSACLASAGDVCENGNCVCNSTGGLVNCSGVCVSESNDPKNCGACGHVCAAGQVCESGTCSTAFTVSKIAVGATFACAIVGSGQVMCWGATSQYASNPAYLGNGSTTGSTTPVAVTGVTTAQAVFAAAFNACALLSSGQVQCWGDNVSGQLGDGTTTNRTSPVFVQGLTNAVAVAGNTDPGGPSFSCAVKATGGVVCWGDNSLGQLGNGTTTNSLTPVAVSGLTNAVAIATGANFACALQQGGTVVCWGSDAGGALDNGQSSGTYTTPVAVSGVTGAVGISADYESACAVKSNGTVVCWGYEGNDALGDGSTANSLTPVAVSGLSNATAIVACDGSSVSSVCAANTAGGAVCWGDNTSGQLGNGTTTASDVPVTVKGLSGVVQIAIGGGAGTGQASACGLLSDGTIKCWGSNQYGQLGNGTNTNSLSPVTVIDL